MNGRVGNGFAVGVGVAGILVGPGATVGVGDGTVVGAGVVGAEVSIGMSVGVAHAARKTMNDANRNRRSCFIGSLQSSATIARLMTMRITS